MAIKLVTFKRDEKTGEFKKIVSPAFQLSKRKFLSLRIHLSYTLPKEKRTEEEIYKTLNMHTTMTKNEMIEIIPFLLADDLAIFEEDKWKEHGIE
jgi:hypothetical protein